MQIYVKCIIICGKIIGVTCFSMRGSVARPRIFYYRLIKEENSMSDVEYRNAVISAAEIAIELSKTLDEYQQDLFEEYGNMYEKIVQYETLLKK